MYATKYGATYGTNNDYFFKGYTDKIYNKEMAVIMIDIFGTLGPSCKDESVLSEMFNVGMTGIRLNLSHAMLTDNTNLLNIVKKAAASVGIEPKLLIDLQGPELRIGDLEEALQLYEDDEVTVLNNDEPLLIEYTEKNITVDQRVLANMDEGDSVLLDDGKIQALVTYKDNKHAKLKIKRAGTLSGRKSILIEGKTVQLPTLTADDLVNINEAVKLGITGVMLPFVRNRQDIRTLRDALDMAGGKDIKIYAKIENLEGVRMLSELIDECDEIVIARGDLGNSMPLWELPAIQKKISKECRQHGRRFMVVTQMLSSMEHSPIPTRAEVSDIYNAVQDGASSVMVTGETAIGDFPTEVIRYLTNTAHESEKNRKTS